MSAFGNIARLLQKGEDRRDAKLRTVDLRAHSVGKRARDILIKAAARDVRDRLDRHFACEREQGLDVNLCRGQKAFADGLSKLVGIHVQIRVLHIEHLAHQRKAVGVHAGGGER